MFEEFLYTLRRGGLKVSLTEWMSLMEALDKGLHRSSFTGFPASPAFTTCAGACW